MDIFPAHAPDHAVVFVDGIQELNHAGLQDTGVAEIVEAWTLILFDLLKD